MLGNTTPHSPMFILALQRDYIFWGIIVAALAGASFVTFWFVRKRRRVWKEFAKQNGLDYSVRLRPQVNGSVAERDFQLAVTNRSSDRGLFGIQDVVMRLSVSTGVGRKFEITNEGVLLTALREATGDEEVAHIEASDFDARTCLRTDDVESLRRYLNDDRRTAMLKLIDECLGCNVHLTESELRVHDRTSGRTCDQLNQRLAAMCAAATAFDEHGESTPTSSRRHDVSSVAKNASSGI